MDIIKYCKYCGKQYVAHTMMALYCSQACNRKAWRKTRREKRLQDLEERIKEEQQENSIADLQKSKDYLTALDLAKFLGISRSSVYRYFASGKIKSFRLGKTAYVRRADFEALFTTAPEYQKRKYRRKDEGSEYYTLKQVMTKFHISKRAALNRCEKFSIPKVYEGRNVFFKRSSIDLHFAELIEEIDLANYYTIPQLMEKLNMSKSNVLTFVSHHQIPRITRGRMVYYSKIHIDSFKRKGEGIDVNWYSYAEIMENYGLTKDQISYYIQHEKLKTERRGKFTMIWRTDFDKKVVAVRFKNAERDEDGRLKFTSQEVGVPESTAAHPIDYTPETPEGYYSTVDLCKKYCMNPSPLHKYLRKHKVCTIQVKGFNFYLKEEIDNLFAEREQHEGVEEWITPEQMKDRYSMTPDACRSFVYRHKIPTKVEYGQTFYSKTHIDKVKGVIFDGMENYYSVQEAAEKYHLTKDQVFYNVKQYKISKVHCGKLSFILKSKFDEIIAKRVKGCDFAQNSSESQELLLDD